MPIKVPANTRVAVITSRFNPEITEGLKAGAIAELRDAGVSVADGDLYAAPGAFEIPLIARELARSGRYRAVVCLGCVIKGDTAHFEYISNAASAGLMQATLDTGIPLGFGILTTYTEEQAIARSRDNAENKGREAAAACLEALAVLDGIARQ